MLPLSGLKDTILKSIITKGLEMPVTITNLNWIGFFTNLGVDHDLITKAIYEDVVVEVTSKAITITSANGQSSHNILISPLTLKSVKDGSISPAHRAICIDTITKALEQAMAGIAGAGVY